MAVDWCSTCCAYTPRPEGTANECLKCKERLMNPKDCICHETVHGKNTCPVHGKLCPVCGDRNPNPEEFCPTCEEIVGNLVAPDPEDTAPDWSKKCIVCGAKPVVPITGMCGPCTFGEAETAGGNW